VYPDSIAYISWPTLDSDLYNDVLIIDNKFSFSKRRSRKIYIDMSTCFQDKLLYVVYQREGLTGGNKYSRKMEYSMNYSNIKIHINGNRIFDRITCVASMIVLTQDVCYAFPE